jgi:hypothetical protein
MISWKEIDVPFPRHLLAFLARFLFLFLFPFDRPYVSISPYEIKQYDVMRCLKECDVEVSYGKITTAEDDGTCDLDVFLKDASDGGPIKDTDLLSELSQRLRVAVAWPLCMCIRDVFDGAFTELSITCALDSGGRGRPRVIFGTCPF